MKNLKYYKKDLEKLLESISMFHNEYCLDEPKNRMIRGRNQNIIKLVKREISDIGE